MVPGAAVAASRVHPAAAHVRGHRRAVAAAGRRGETGVLRRGAGHGAVRGSSPSDRRQEPGFSLFSHLFTTQPQDIMKLNPLFKGLVILLTMTINDVTIFLNILIIWVILLLFLAFV